MFCYDNIVHKLPSSNIPCILACHILITLGMMTKITFSNSRMQSLLWLCNVHKASVVYPESRNWWGEGGKGSSADGYGGRDRGVNISSPACERKYFWNIIFFCMIHELVFIQIIVNSLICNALSWRISNGYFISRLKLTYLPLVLHICFTLNIRLVWAN